MLYNSLQMKISVLSADDSEIMRKVIADLLQADSEIELVDPVKKLPFPCFTMGTVVRTAPC